MYSYVYLYILNILNRDSVLSLQFTVLPFKINSKSIQNQFTLIQNQFTSIQNQFTLKFKINSIKVGMNHRYMFAES